MGRRVIGISGALIAVAVAVSLAPQRGKASDIDNVLVVNGPKRPIPVTLAGGAGTANVNIVNQPTVSLAPGVSVNIANGATQPVPTRDVDSPALQPFSAVLNLQPGQPRTIQVPAGTRLVIQTVSAFNEVATTPRAVSVATTISGTPVLVIIPFTVRNAGSFLVQQLTQYTDPGGSVTVTVGSPVAGDGAEVVIIGNLVNAA
jgi:hypothetical protein